jgi:hypothetical protein
MYEESLKRQFHDGAVKYFDDLVKESGIDLAKYQADWAIRNQKKKAYDVASNASKAASGKNTAFVVFEVICFIIGGITLPIGILSALNAGTYYLAWILVGAILLILGIVLAVVRHNKVKKELASAKSNEDDKADKLDDAEKVCADDIAALNSSFDWNAPQVIMERTTPIIDLDPYFSAQRYEFLKDKFGLLLNESPDESVLGVLSGNIQGNSFVLERVLSNTYCAQSYTGSLYITWEVYVHDKNGGHYETRSETLYATVYHDAPHYGEITRLLYGNEAAPHLSFTRDPSGASTMDERERASAIKKRKKALSKKADEAVAEGKSFTPLGNDEFDAFFGGDDRNNEVEYRLLFTPLAQANELDLILNDKPYGDDFTFIKRGMANCIISRHSQSFDYSAAPSFFRGIDLEKMKSDFVSYCDQFIQGLYFDLAPLLSIPLYQMHKPHEEIYKESLGRNYAPAEHEAVANKMNPDCFRPKRANPSLPLILRAKEASAQGKTDVIEIHSYSYRTTPMVDYVPVRGGDGHTHQVPVHWTKYDKVSGDSPMLLKDIGGSEKSYRTTASASDRFKEYLSDGGSSHFERGLLGVYLARDIESNEDRRLSSIFSKRKKS